MTCKNVPIRRGPVAGGASSSALIGLSLAGLTAGGFTVGTEGQCHGEATTRVAVTGARNGPKGTAVGKTGSPSDGPGLPTGPRDGSDPPPS